MQQIWDFLSNSSNGHTFQHSCEFSLSCLRDLLGKIIYTLVNGQWYFRILYDHAYFVSENGQTVQHITDFEGVYKTENEFLLLHWYKPCEHVLAINTPNITLFKLWGCFKKIETKVKT